MDAAHAKSFFSVLQYSTGQTLVGIKNHKSLFFLSYNLCLTQDLLCVFVGQQSVKNFFPISLRSLGANRYNFENCSKAIHKKSKCEGHWRLE